jgi:3',5'-cyclic AMP phosphodiesterase CpdA
MTRAPSIEWVMVQLTDCHVVERGRLAMDLVDTASFLRDAIDTTNALDPAPDLVVISGDLVDDGRPAQYDHLAEMVRRIDAPVLLMPGNHDSPATLRATIPAADRLPEHAVEHDGPFLDVVIDGPVRVIALDSSRGPDPSGRLEPSQLSWLDEQLGAEPDRPTVVLLHHPPFATGIVHMDQMALDATSSAGLAEVIGRHPHVERICCGHLHRTISRRFAGTIAATAPSVAHSVAWDLTGQPAAASLEPPAITVLLWGPELGLVAHQRAVGSYEVLRA